MYLLNMYLAVLVAGFGGGAIRGLVGFIKHQYSYKHVGFEVPYFLAMLFVSGTVGLLSAVAADGIGADLLGGYLTPAMAFFIGYAGGDFIENLFKTIIKKPSLYSPPEDLRKK